MSAHVFGKASGSNSLSHNQSCTKRARHDKTIRSSSSKGVVALMNENWAAHVYVNHNWTCIGIFKTEEEAEMAYDSVDESLRKTDNIAQEPNIQKQVCIAGSLSCRSVNIFQAQRQQDCTRTCLFEKVLTASDVGHKLAFYDQSMTLWNFRYGVCKGSNSYVLSSGWKDFVRAKDLRSADKVIFFNCELFETGSAVHTYFAIDVEYNANRVQVEEANRGKYVIADGEKLHSKEGVQNFGLEQNHSGNGDTRLEMDIKGDSDLNIIDSRKAPETSVMLFGVKIA
ncbi:AP2/ERF and B3 domain-containing transcription factor At1g51120-like [Apium graveolens]|uniref:AP2/ERF and B3 domain-containing transcription factor At1g51120-like n=1 Tax=Apium graveolens TaxID=4045 RepID=UPI003D79B399